MFLSIEKGKNSKKSGSCGSMPPLLLRLSMQLKFFRASVCRMQDLGVVTKILKGVRNALRMKLRQKKGAAHYQSSSWNITLH